jgi:hypothetical protein
MLVLNLLVEGPAFCELCNVRFPPIADIPICPLGVSFGRFTALVSKHDIERGFRYSEAYRSDVGKVQMLRAASIF